jgi:D-alanyl-D-alanine carboxypeptidase
LASALLLVGLAAVATSDIAAAAKSDPVGRHPAQPVSASALQAALDEVVAAGSPGAILLVRDGVRTTRLSSGYGNLATKSPIRPADRARLGGMTKSFTATVVLQLVGEGKLALDDTVERWLPGVISNGNAISIRQLLNHTSGIYSFDKDPRVLAPYYKGDLTRIFDARTGVKIAAEHGPLFAPGSKLSYSNTNYFLLGMIVKAATGNSLASELRGRIFEPLGLRHTTYSTSSQIDGSYIHGYLLVGKPPLRDVTPFSPTLYGPAGAILSNANDVARFYRALLGGSLLKPDLLNSMRTIDPVATGGIPDAGIRGGGWGLGLLRERFPCGEAWGHDAEHPGYMTAAWNSKDGARQVVVVVNSNFSHNAPVSRAMRNVLVKGYCGSA